MGKIITQKVDELWDKRFELSIPHKKARLAVFFDTFGEIIDNVHTGHKYTVKEVEETDYWKYIKGYHPNWMVEPLSSRAERQMRRMFWNGIELYHDIKKRGMLNPLEMRKADGIIHLYAGYRRLVILKTLETEIAKVLLP